LAVAASSCGGESESKQETSAAGAALPGLERVFLSSLLNSTSPKNPTVLCSTDVIVRRVVGGGAEIIGPQSAVALNSITPVPSLAAVTAVASEIGPVGTNGNWQLKSYAVCASRPPGGSQLVSVETALDSTSPKNPTVNCPAGKKVLGAGGQINGAQDAVALTSVTPLPSLGGVTTVATELGGGTNASWSVKSYAICASPPAGLTLVSAQSGLDSNSPKSATATCPGGKSVLGTGAEISSASQHQITLSSIVPSANLTSVTAGATEIGGGTNATWSLKAYAICA
jgi:hypothetical protein